MPIKSDVKYIFYGFKMTLVLQVLIVERRRIEPFLLICTKWMYNAQIEANLYF